MPLVRGEHGDDPHRPRGRIRNTRKLLATAGIIMSFMLLGSSIVTAMLIDPKALITEGQAANRALAYVAHGDANYNINPMFGPLFGTIYDISTVAILWFAGASAMSGLLNLVPRYLPRFGMAPRWAEAVRWLVIHFTFINIIVTLIFDASVIAQGGAYATGVMVLMSSGAIAVVIDLWLKSSGPWWRRLHWGYLGDDRGVSLHDGGHHHRKAGRHQNRRGVYPRSAGVFDRLAHAAEHGAAVR